MSDESKQLSDYEMKKSWQQKKREEERKKRESKKKDEKINRQKIQDLPDKADGNSKKTLRRQILSKLNQGTTQTGKELVGRLVKSMLKKFILWLGGVIVSLWWLWAILIALFLLIAFVVHTIDDACDHALTKHVAQMVFSISCEEPGAEVSGGGASGSQEDKSKETWKANGCKSSGETNAEGGYSCGGSCQDFSPTGIKSTQCSDASPALVDLLDCIDGKLGSYPGLSKSDIILTSISDDHGLSKCRDNYSYQCSAGSSDPNCCFHTQGSCHYRADGSHAVDIRTKDNTLTASQISDLEEIVKSSQCGGKFLVEGDHIHISDSGCSGT